MTKKPKPKEIKILIGLIERYYPEPQEGIRLFNELLEFNKISYPKADIVSLFIDFSTYNNFTQWIKVLLNDNSDYFVKPFEKFSENIEEEYMYRKGFRQGFAEAIHLLENSNGLDILKQRLNQIESWALSRFMKVDVSFSKDESEIKIIKSKLNDYLQRAEVYY